MTLDPALRIVDPDPGWAEAARRELDRIAGALGTVAVRLDHVGSTAVPGLPAKPIIDLQVSVAVLEPPSAGKDAEWRPSKRERSGGPPRCPEAGGQSSSWWSSPIEKRTTSPAPGSVACVVTYAQPFLSAMPYGAVSPSATVSLVPSGCTRMTDPARPGRAGSCP